MARLVTRNGTEKLSDIDAFDIVIVDEASQMDVGHFLPALLRIKAAADSHSKIVIAGDDKQLQPIRKEEITGERSVWFGSIYNYFKACETVYGDPLISPVSLDISRRSNHCIIDFIKLAFGYNSSFTAMGQNSLLKTEYCHDVDLTNLPGKALHPDTGIVLLEYDDGLSSQRNEFEAERINELVNEAWQYGFRSAMGGAVDFKTFFSEKVGIVVPHTAQRTAVRKLLFTTFRNNLTGVPDADIRIAVNDAVDTVERFQGQERDLIIAGYLLGNEDAISHEEAFIYDQCRLNVIISRAKCKAVVLASRELMDNISNEAKIIELQKSFHILKDYCDEVSVIDDPVWRGGKMYCKKI